MNDDLKNQLSNIFRCIENDLGTTGLSLLCLKVVTKAAENFQSKNVEDFFEQLREILMLVKNTKPKIGLIISYFCQIWDELQDRRESLLTMDDVRTAIAEISDLLLKENEADNLKIIKLGLETIEENDSILIHSHSRLVLRVIEAAFNAKKKFRVILAEQEEEKTMDMIHFLQDRDIPFFVIPEFMLSHVENDVTKVFLGGLTLNKESNFVTDAGTNSVVSEFHHIHTPIYMFIATRKFSLWETTAKQQTYKVNQKRFERHPGKTSFYERVKFSHDRIPTDLLDKVVTEEGIFSPKQIEKKFDAMYKSHAELRKRHFSK